MSEDWFDIAFINSDEAILHGTAVGGRVIRKALTEAERARIEALAFKHDMEMNKLLRELAA